MQGQGDSKEEVTFAQGPPLEPMEKGLQCWLVLIKLKEKEKAENSQSAWTIWLGPDVDHLGLWRNLDNLGQRFTVNDSNGCDTKKR